MDCSNLVLFLCMCVCVSLYFTSFYFNLVYLLVFLLLVVVYQIQKLLSYEPLVFLLFHLSHLCLQYRLLLLKNGSSNSGGALSRIRPGFFDPTSRCLRHGLDSGGRCGGGGVGGGGLLSPMGDRISWPPSGCDGVCELYRPDRHERSICFMQRSV